MTPEGDHLEELEAEERRNRALLDAIPDNMFRIRSDGTYVDFRSNHPEALTLAPDRIVGTNIADHMSAEDARIRLDAIRRVIATGEAESFEIQVVTRDGQVVDEEVRMVKSGPDEVLAITRDITDRKEAERELRRSRARIVEAEAAERRRLERNLHDGAQQRLVSLSLALRLAQAKLPADATAAAALLADASDELALALQELRELARGIHPAILTDRGLGPALEALAERAPVPVELIAVPEERVSEPVEAAAFYVVAESLTNVAKYAQASRATVGVLCASDALVVEVADDGVGGADPAAGTGLRGLVDRVAALDGTLEVESEAGAGTLVRAVIPFAD